jgi:hypothetical protein
MLSVLKLCVVTTRSVIMLSFPKLGDVNLSVGVPNAISIKVVAPVTVAKCNAKGINVLTTSSHVEKLLC